MKRETPGRLFDDYVSLCAARDGYAAEGWDWLPCDNPERGGIGYIVFRDVEKDGETTEENLLLEWPVFGAVACHTHDVWTPLLAFGGRKTDDQIMSDLAAVLDMLDGKNVYRADDAMRRLVGFAFYEPGKVHVARIPLTVLKNALSSDVGRKLYDLWLTAKSLRADFTPQTASSAGVASPQGASSSTTA